MAAYRLKRYKRREPRERPGTLASAYAIEAEDNAAAISRLTADYAEAIATCDLAFIAGPYGRIVWEAGRRS